MCVVLVTKYVITLLHSDMKLIQYHPTNRVHMQMTYTYFSPVLEIIQHSRIYTSVILVFKSVLYSRDRVSKFYLTSSHLMDF